MRRRLILFLCATLCAAMPAMANHYASFYVIPIAGHTAGANGTFWVSDVAIQNIQNRPLDVSLVFIQTGENTTDNVDALANATIPARGSVLLADVVSGWRGLENVTGAILIGADAAFAVNSRAYNHGSNVGQGITAFRDFLDNTLGTTDNAALAYVPGLTANNARRTNVGFVAGTANGTSPMVIRITLRDAAGAVLGERDFTVPAGGALEHYQTSTATIVSGTFDLASAEFRIVSGNGAVVPYASIINNTSADGIFVAGQFPANTAASGKVGLPSPFELLFARYARK